MPRYNLPPDQNQYQIRIGIERPISELTRSFFVHGQAPLGLPRVSVDEFCASMTAPTHFLRDDEVPLIYARRGMIHFGSARWGSNDTDGARVNVQQVDGRSVGYPALIPATFVDLALHLDVSSKSSSAVRLRPGVGATLFIACAFKNNTFGEAQTVTPLVCQAGPDIARHIGWQPVLVPIAGPPTHQHFDFLLRRNQARVLVPSASRDVKTEITSWSAVAGVC